MISNKRLRKAIRMTMATLPALPFLARRRSHTSAYVMGGLGAAILGGIAAVLFFSPRTRTRALDVAKETYGKVEDRVRARRHGGTRVNGLASDEPDYPQGV